MAILGAVIPFIYASSTTLALFVTTVRGDSSSTSGTKGRRKQHRFRSINSHSTNARSNGGIARGIEESKGYYVDEEFLDSAQEPLIRQESNGGSNMLGEAGSEERRTPKKETGVHWLKLLLYWVQVFYHLCVGCFFLVDGHGNHPYKCERFPAETVLVPPGRDLILVRYILVYAANRSYCDHKILSYRRK